MESDRGKWRSEQKTLKGRLKLLYSFRNRDGNAGKITLKTPTERKTVTGKKSPTWIL